ncbi:hypothetical protein [Plantactinospora sp. GCM10030261]|uniref:hypothetical protein n=1 Tax=Plantactinospora sp. GCM10030261 TaxID=3273420 RepID=UPI0036085A64
MTLSRVTCARAEALFVSAVQPSERPTAYQVRRAVAHSLLRHRLAGCAALVAQEYGDHPGAALDRMRWAVAAVRNAYPASRVAAAPAPRPRRTEVCAGRC